MLTEDVIEGITFSAMQDFSDRMMGHLVGRETRLKSLCWTKVVDGAMY